MNGGEVEGHVVLPTPYFGEGKVSELRFRQLLRGGVLCMNMLCSIRTFFRCSGEGKVNDIRIPSLLRLRYKKTAVLIRILFLESNCQQNFFSPLGKLTSENFLRERQERDRNKIRIRTAVFCILASGGREP